MKPYVVIKNFGHQTIDTAANIRKQHKNVRAIVAAVRDRSIESTCPRIRLIRATSFFFSFSKW
jgi:hypothetical protein